MPYQRKTLSTLLSEIASDIKSALAGADAMLRFAVLNVVGKVQGVMSNAQFGYLDWISKMSVPFTAEDEYLQGWAALKNVVLKGPTAAVLQVSFPGTAGKTLDAGVSVIRSDGVTYTTNATATVDSSGALSVAVTAAATGSAGTADPGTSMTLGVAADGIQSQGTVTAIVSSGADVETNDELRTRMLSAFQETPQGGASTDYTKWALAISGVTRAWCRGSGFGLGTVVLYTMFDDAESAHNGFPQGTDGVSQYDEGPDGTPRGTVATGDQLVVADAILTLQPVTPILYSCSPLKNSITITLGNLSSASSATKALISAAIADVFYRKGDPSGGTVDRSDITAAINAISGTSGYIIESIVGVAGTVTTTYGQNITSSIGYLPILAEILYPTS